MQAKASPPVRAFRFVRDCLRWDRAFARNVFMVALPMILQQLVAASLHIIDGLMVSGLGDAACVRELRECRRPRADAAA